MELFKLLGTIAVENEEANRNLDETTRAARGAGDGMDDADSSARNLSSGGFSILKGAAAQLVAEGLMRVGNAIGNLISDAAGFQNQIEQYETSFAVMTGSAEEAAEVTQRLKEIGAATPFELTDLADTTQLLMNYGFSADAAIESMNMLGDISQGNADKMNRISMAYGQMSSAGKVSLEDVKQMIEAGFNPLQEISETTGESMESLYDRISKGTISVDEITASMRRSTSEGGKYFGSMNAQSQTLSGRLSTLKDTLNNSLGTAMSGILDNLANSVLPTLTSIIEGIDWEGIAVAITGMFEQLMPPLMELAETLLPVIVDLIVMLAPFLADFVSMILPQLMSLINQLLPALLPLLETLLPLVNDILTPMLALLESFMPILLPIVEFLAGAFTAAINNIGVVINWLIGVFTNLFNQTKTIFTNIGNTVTNIFNTVGSAIRSVIDWLVGVFSGFFESTRTIFNNIKDAVSNAFSAMGTAVGNIWDGIWGTIKGVINSILGGVEGMVNGVVRAINVLLGGIDTVVEGVGDLIGLSWNVPTLNEVSLPRLAKGGVLEEGQVGLLEGSGAEAVVPLDQNRAWISAVAKDMQGAVGTGTNAQMQELIEAFRDFVDALPEMMMDAFTAMKFDVNNREFARLVKAVN